MSLLKEDVSKYTNAGITKFAVAIASLTATRPDAVQKFADTNNLNIEKLYQFLKKSKLDGKMNFVSALVGRDGNPIQKKMIKMFQESVNEERDSNLFYVLYQKKDGKFSKPQAAGYKSREDAEKFAKSLNNHSTMILDKNDWSGVKGVKVTNESVNEGVSPADMDKIKGAVEAASSFMSVGSELKKLGMKYTFATEPLPIYIIQPTPNNKVAIVNKKYATKPDFVVGDIAVGIMEGKLNEEEIKWNAVENAIINFLKMNTKILDKRVQAKDTEGVKGGLKSIISGLVNAQRNLKLESVNEAGYTVKAENPYQFVNGAYAVLSAYLKDEELGPKGKRELQDIIKSLDYMRKYFYFKMSESVNEIKKGSIVMPYAMDKYGEFIVDKVFKNKSGETSYTGKFKKSGESREFILHSKDKVVKESVNEEKYTVIDPMGNQKGVGPKIQAISMAKRLGGEKTGHFVVANTNALKARRALEKFKGDFKNPKLKDMMMNLYYESVNERIVKEKVK